MKNKLGKGIVATSFVFSALVQAANTEAKTTLDVLSGQCRTESKKMIDALEAKKTGYGYLIAARLGQQIAFSLIGWNGSDLNRINSDDLISGEYCKAVKQVNTMKLDEVVQKIDADSKGSKAESQDFAEELAEAKTTLSKPF